MVYLDWAATALPDTSVLESKNRAEMEYFGNPSSLHGEGKKARELLLKSRGKVADALGCSPAEVVFTSGGTESNNMIIFSLLQRIPQQYSRSEQKRKKHVVISGLEHPSVYNPASSLEKMGFRVTIIRGGEDGRIRPERVAAALDEQTVFVSLMFVNNETGAIQPVKEVGQLIKTYAHSTGRNIVFHVDAVQGFGKLPFKPLQWSVDTASISAHKLGGPKGSGALFLRKGVTPGFLYKGGEQEEKQRPGTEDTAGCYGLALAAEKSTQLMEERYEKVRGIMTGLIQNLSSIRGIVFIPAVRSARCEGDFSPYILKIAFPPVPGEVLVRMCNERGFLISTGSACSSRQKKSRHRVLEHMGIKGAVALSSIRISIGWETKGEDCIAFSHTLKKLISELRRISV
jgi:cysteine desulfurase